ncbi:unnamed protein product [Rotaria sp. Silwood1]|nr:unnamed protein product [Rotaria sp. Silwood1]
MLDYIKEVTQGLSKMSINRIRRASIEKDEWDALKAFENVAPEQQKIYAKTFCKSALKAYEKKKKNFDLVAAHISSYDIIPKILQQDDVFNLLVDENSLSSEQVQDNKENIHKISRDFRLKATELYLKIVKEEFEFDKERLEKLLEDFPQDSDEVLPLTQIVNDEEPFDDEENINNNNDDDEEEEIFTQRPLPPRRKSWSIKYPSSIQLKEINYLQKRIEATQTVLRKTDKSKVFHLGKFDDYKEKAQAYMIKTKAYQDLGTNNLLESLVERTNEFIFGLWYNKHITQKQYEKLKVNKEEAELAHLYFLPKSHKPGTPLRPIMSGLKSPTIAISRWLDSLLRPLFDRLASENTIENGTQLIKQVEKWSANYLTPATSFITMDMTDLYTMIPQEGGIAAIKKLIEASNLKQIDGVKKEIILALARFVMTNNYFYLDESYYKQIRGGAMGSPLTLIIANAYMYFIERPIKKWAKKTCSLYYRYIDDLFIMSNVHVDILKGLTHTFPINPSTLDKNKMECLQQPQRRQYTYRVFGNRTTVSIV